MNEKFQKRTLTDHGEFMWFSKRNDPYKIKGDEKKINDGLSKKMGFRVRKALVWKMTIVIKISIHCFTSDTLFIDWAFIIFSWVARQLRVRPVYLTSIKMISPDPIPQKGNWCHPSTSVEAEHSETLQNGSISTRSCEKGTHAPCGDNGIEVRWQLPA